MHNSYVINFHAARTRFWQFVRRSVRKSSTSPFVKIVGRALAQREYYVRRRDPLLVTAHYTVSLLIHLVNSVQRVLHINELLNHCTQKTITNSAGRNYTSFIHRCAPREEKTSSSSNVTCQALHQNGSKKERSGDEGEGFARDWKQQTSHNRSFVGHLEFCDSNSCVRYPQTVTQSCNWCPFFLKEKYNFRPPTPTPRPNTSFSHLSIIEHVYEHLWKVRYEGHVLSTNEALIHGYIHQTGVGQKDRNSYALV